MKKAIVLLLALVAVVGFAFAEDAKYSVAADATVTWGYDVETGATGFTNATSFELTFPLAAGDLEAKGENVYGQISVTGIDFSLVSEGDEDLTLSGDYTLEAKIVFGKAYVQIDSAPGFELNNAQLIGPVYDPDGDWEDASVIADTAGATGGLTIGYAADMFSVALQVASNGNWAAIDASDSTSVLYTASGAEAVVAGVTYTDLNGTAVLATALVAGRAYYKITAATDGVGANVDSQYTLGFTASVTPIKMLTIDVAAFMDAWDGGNKGATLGLTLAPVEALEVTAGADFSIAGAADMIMDFAAGATYTLANADAVALKTYFAPAASWDTLNGADPAVNPYLEVGFSFTEDGEKGLVPALGFSAYAKAYDLLDSTDTGAAATDGLPIVLGGTVDYTVTIAEGKTVKPYASFDYNLSEVAGAEPFGNRLHYVVGAEAAVLANTTITAEFEAGSLNDLLEQATGTVNGSDLTGNKGVFTLACTIELP